MTSHTFRVDGDFQSSFPGGSPPPSGAKNQILGHGSACTMCRVRKVRCDGVRPICTPCAASQRECVYLHKRKLPGPVSAAVLGAKLAGLQERYAELLSQLPGAPNQATRPGISDDDQSTPNSLGLLGSSYSFPGEMSDMDRDTILKVFFQEQCRTIFYETSGDVFTALNHPSESHQPLPALVDAMILLGSVFIRLPIHETEDTAALLKRLPPSELLVARIHSNISDSLARLDRLKHAFSATSLLCQWLFFQGRLQEAQYLSSSMARIIIGAKLHQIDADFLEGISNDTLAASNPTPWDDTLLGRPQSLREVGSRILVFWQAFIGEKLISMVTGLPSAYDDSAEAKITTAWPRSLDEYESGVAFQDGDADSMHELLFPTNTEGMASQENRYRDTMLAMLAQVFAITECTSRLAAEIQTTPEISQSQETQDTLLRFHAAVSNMTTRIPSTATSDRPRSTIAEEFKDNDFVKSNLVSHLWLMLYVSEIQVCRSLEVHYALSEDIDPSSAERSIFYHNLAVEKAKMAAGVIRATYQQTTEADARDVNPTTTPNQITGDPISLPAGFYLAPAAITLADELCKLEKHLEALKGPHHHENLPQSALQARFNEVEGDFLAVRQFLESISRQYPILDFQLVKLDNVRMGIIM